MSEKDAEFIQVQEMSSEILEFLGKEHISTKLAFLTLESVLFNVLYQANVATAETGEIFDTMKERYISTRDFVEMHKNNDTIFQDKNPQDSVQS